MQEAVAISFTNNNAANVLNVAEQSVYEAQLYAKYPEATIAWDFVPVLVYVANNECVGYYDEELEHGFIA